MGNFGRKVEKFIEIFIEQNGYVTVLEGLQNTVLIAVMGLIIGIVIGTIIAVCRVIPQYKTLPKILNGICTFYVGLFRGTPMVVQLLVSYYVLLPLLGIRMTGVQVAIMVFGLNSGAYISEIMRSGINSVDPGQMEGGYQEYTSNPWQRVHCSYQGDLRRQLCRCSRPLCGLQLHRQQQLRIHGAIPCNGSHLHCPCAAHQPWNQSYGKEPEEE